MDTSNDIPLKQCSKCGEWKPQTNEYFRVRPSGLERKCRTCLNAHRNALRPSKTGRVNHRTDKEGYKVCPKCGTRKSVSEDYHHKADGKPFSYCKQCRNSHGQRYYCEHVEKRAAYAKDYRRNNPEKVALNVLRWQQANPEKVSAKALRYQKRHPEIKRATEANRRAKKRLNGGTHTGADIRLQIKAQTDKRGKLHCWWCSVVILDTYHIDHRIPLARGGSNAPENLCISCPTCNLGKHDKLPQEWNGRLL